MQVIRNRKHVVIVQRRLTSYRIRLFELMREKLAADGIELSLIVGSGTAAEEMKQDGGNLDWAIKVPTKYFLGGKLCWQPFARHAKDADLVVVTQENKLLSNFLAMTIQRPKRLAFWGHGANLQSDNPDGWRERFKRWTSCRVDWWFAYTGMSVELVKRCGFSGERITNLENAVDTTELLQLKAGITAADTAALRQHGLAGAKVGVFVGSLYDDKRLDFLFACAQLIRQQCPTFQLLLIGNGPQRALVEDFCASHATWCHYLGVQKGRDKMRYLSLADVMLNPGLVGLGILDSFVAGVPMMTTDCGLHSPEVDYLQNGVNGVMTANTEAAYVEAVLRVLQDDACCSRLQQGALASAAHYTIENMADNFCHGIRKALAG